MLYITRIGVAMTDYAERMYMTSTILTLTFQPVYATSTLLGHPSR